MSACCVNSLFMSITTAFEAQVSQVSSLMMGRATSTLMTRDEIRTEFGWSDDMIRRLLQISDAPASIRGKHRCDRYYRERVLATAQTREARVAKMQWDETLRGHTPNPGWTTRLGDVGAVVGVSAVAVGKILELLGYRLDKSVTDSAVAAGCGVRRWDGYALHYDWHLDRVVSAIRSTVDTWQTSSRRCSRSSNRQTIRKGASREL